VVRAHTPMICFAQGSVPEVAVRRMRMKTRSSDCQKEDLVLKGVVLIVAVSLGVAVSTVTSAQSSSPIVNCPNVRGGALSKTVVRGISCKFAQRIWNHFAGNSTSALPPLPTGWRCLSFLMTVNYPLSEVDCAGRSWKVWARFTET
jgi:hypothetical protein